MIGAAKELCGRSCGCEDWTRWGTEGFLGLQCSQGPTRCEARMALILMGDWCATAQPSFENKCALNTPASNTGFAEKVRGRTQNVDRPY